MSDDWTLSASKLKQFARCPESFYHTYMMGRRGLVPENRYIRRGNAVHETLESVLRADPVWTDELSVQLKAAYHNFGGQDEWDLSDEDHRFVIECLEVAARYLVKLAPEVRAVELEVEFGVSDPRIWRDFGGFVDLATDRGVLDWKTGKSEGKELDEALQGGVYMAGYAHEFGEVPEYVRFVYLKEETVRSVDPSDELWDTVIDHADRVLRAIERDEFPADPESSKCHWCDVEPFCSASPVGGGNVDWSEYP